MYAGQYHITERVEKCNVDFLGTISITQSIKKAQEN